MHVFKLIPFGDLINKSERVHAGSSIIFLEIIADLRSLLFVKLFSNHLLFQDLLGCDEWWWELQKRLNHDEFWFVKKNFVE